MKIKISLGLLLSLASILPFFAAEKEPKQLSEVPSSIRNLEAMANTPQVQYFLGNGYYEGNFAGVKIKPDMTLAIQWLKRAAAQGHKRANEDLGSFYFSGIGVDKSVETALSYLRCADQTDPLVKLVMGQCIMTKEHSSVADITEAKRVLTEAMDLFLKAGKTDEVGKACLCLSIAYTIGHNSDEVRSLAYLKKAVAYKDTAALHVWMS